MNKDTNLDTIVNGINVHLPNALNTGDGTVFGAIIKAIGSKYEDYYSDINHVDNLLGIDTTSKDELDRVWGKRIGIRRRVGESDQRYRNRIKTSVLKLYGGTASALRYATLVALNRDKYPYLDEDNSGVQVFDAKDYNGVTEVDKKPGNSVIQIDTGILDNVTLNEQEYDDLINILNDVKASGVKIKIILVMFDSDYIALRSCLDEEWALHHEELFDYSDWNLKLNIHNHDIVSDYTIFNGYEDRVYADDDYDMMLVKEINYEESVFANEPPSCTSTTNDNNSNIGNTLFISNDQIIDK